MNTIRLYGALGKEFGTEHRFAITSPGEAFQALAANFPRFTDKLRHGFYKLIIGARTTGTELDEKTILSHRIGTEDIHIIPATKGRGRGGLGKVLAGILLVGLAAFGGPLMATSLGAGGMTVGTAVGHMGLGLTLTGVAQLLAPSQDTGESDPSYTMAGPTNSTREGGIIPIVYGECVVGGSMISGQLRIENAVDETSTEGSTLLPLTGRIG
ncbi:hypothetical protein [Neotabrizicola sp. VNH66]|uniref:hypothetical protein n=1 Tax=Neotabrizicola sp. VNH66 TaxID=3400918 RepID=UPI003BFE616C